MRQMTGSMLLLSAAAVAAAPLADAEERTIQLTEAEKQEIQAANEKLLGLTLRFLHDSWPLEIMFAGEAQQEFHSILQCYRMLEQFRETGNLMLQAPDRNTPLHLCIALGLNQLAIRMIEAGAPVNAQSIFMHDGTKEPGDTPLTWACLSGLYMNSTAEDRLPLVQSLLKHGADPDQPGPWGVTPFMYSAALNDSASSAFPLPFTNGSSRQAATSTNASLKASSLPCIWSAPRKNRRNASSPSLNFSSRRERTPTSRTWTA